LNDKEFIVRKSAFNALSAFPLDYLKSELDLIEESKQVQLAKAFVLIGNNVLNNGKEPEPDHAFLSI
jgi:hypothetical protein